MEVLRLLGAPQVTRAFLRTVAFGFFLVRGIFRDNSKLNFKLSFTLTLRLAVALTNTHAPILISAHLVTSLYELLVWALPLIVPM